MNSEHEQKWGKSLIGPFIYFEINSILETTPSKRPVKGRVADTINMIVAQLVIDKVPFETLEHLRVNFTKPVDSAETITPADQNLEGIKKILGEEFGREVVRRLELSIEKEKVRTLPR